MDCCNHDCSQSDTCPVRLAQVARIKPHDHAPQPDEPLGGWIVLDDGGKPLSPDECAAVWCVIGGMVCLLIALVLAAAA